MKSAMTALLVLAGLALIPPALIEQEYVLSGIALALTVIGSVLLRRLPTSRWSDLLLIVEGVVAVLAMMTGLHPFFPVFAFALQLAAWNLGHRLGHLESAVADRRAMARTALRLLSISVLASLVVVAIATAFLYVKLPMTFGIGLGLSLCVLLLLAVFVRFTQSAHRDDDA